VDVGANIGDFAVQAARRCPQGRVVAVEPLRSAGGQIATQARLNGVSNITWCHAALSAVEGEASTRPEGAFYRTAADAAEPARILTLAGLMAEQGLSHIDLLKLDCEGAEWDILPAAEPLLPQVAQICMEYHQEGSWTAEKLGARLTACGFTVKIQSGGGWNGLLWARRGGLL
jgi:FkbM family methyltransferase